MTMFTSNIANWLQAEKTSETDFYKLTFAEHHLGNIYIRSLHGGVSASFMEICAEAEACNHIDAEARLQVIATATDYLRVTKDANLFARTSIVRISRRLAVIDVTCWQDDETVPVVRGTVTLKITA